MKIEPSDLSELTSFFIRAAIYSHINSDGIIIVRERDVGKIQDLLKGRINFSLSEPMGLYGRWLRLEHKRSRIAAVLLSLALLVILSNLVWDVRVSGNENLSRDEILDMLSECGFGVGSIWPVSDLGAVESSLLVKNENIAWISINRRGTVAYVRVIESNGKTDDGKEEKTGYSNIVASADCIIEEITVRRGIAVVRAGDVVKKGDLLVAGVLPDAAGGGFCYADASVKGRISDTITVDMDREYVKKEHLGSELYSIVLKLFNFSINIFKKYGNLTNEYDIIENEIAYTHPDGRKLPASLTVSYIPAFSEEGALYTDDELIKLASDRLRLITAERLALCDLIRIRTEGEFTERGYRLTSRLVVLTEVGVHLDFTAN
jgi:sporulation protein YqfD